MPNFYCRHTNENTVTSHLPYAGERVVADSAQEAAQAFATSRNLGGNVKILVFSEPDCFQPGQVAGTTLPTYS